MNTAAARILYRAFALFGDALTNYRLEYVGERPMGDETRFQAAARIASTRGGVVPHDTPGYFQVMSDVAGVPPYDVCALPGEFTCPCPDGTISKHNPIGYCKHALAAAMAMAIQEA